VSPFCVVIFGCVASYVLINAKKVYLFEKSEQNILNFLDEVDCINWSNLDGYNDPKICCSKFLERYTKVYEKHFPLKKLRKPWISQGLLKSIKKKNKSVIQAVSFKSLFSERREI